MKTLLITLAIATALFLWQKNHKTPEAAKSQPAAQPAGAIASPAPGQAQHWPKRSIDRARAVAGQASKSKNDSQNP